MKGLWHRLLNFIFPKRCCICNKRLNREDNVLCAGCWFQLPYTGYKGRSGNVVERLFWGKVPIVYANALMRYIPKSKTTLPILKMKYGNRPDIGIYLGQLMAYDLEGTPLLKNIDCIIPVPLNKKRFQQRGYNQSEKLAQGISQVTGIPVASDCVERVVNNPTQTHLTKTERKENVKDVFRVSNVKALKYKHVVLVDDVLTTGSTILACALKIAEVEGVTITILVLSEAGKHYTGVSKLV